MKISAYSIARNSERWIEAMIEHVIPYIDEFVIVASPNNKDNTLKELDRMLNKLSAVSNLQNELTEKEWKEICKDCYTEELWRIRGQYANTPEYLRRFIIYNAFSKDKAFKLGKQEGELKRLKEWLSVLNAEKVMFVADIMAEINAIEKEMKKDV